ERQPTARLAMGAVSTQPPTGCRLPPWITVICVEALHSERSSAIRLPSQVNGALMKFGWSCVLPSAADNACGVIAPVISDRTLRRFITTLNPAWESNDGLRLLS